MYVNNPPACGAQGRLTDADVIKLQNLAMVTGILNWDDQDLTCGMPEGHGRPHHIAMIGTQEFGDKDQWPKVWWASWLDMDELRDEAALFEGPMCNALYEHAEGSLFTCMLLSGHAWGDDEQHMWA